MTPARPPLPLPQSSFPHLAPDLRGKRVYVVGSSPEVRLPREVDSATDAIIAANSAAWLCLAGEGLWVDHWVTTAHLFLQQNGLDRAQVRWLRKLKGKTVGGVWVDTKNAGIEFATDSIKALGVRWRYILEVNDAARASIVERACEARLWVSTGVFGACLAKVSGAKEIVLCGIDPESKGHAIQDPYDEIANPAPRMHVEEDRRALAQIRHQVLTWGERR